MIVTIVALSIVAIIVTLIGGGVGAHFSEGMWPAIAILPLIGLPIGFVLILALLIITGRRRAREAAADTQPPAKNQK